MVSRTKKKTKKPQKRMAKGIEAAPLSADVAEMIRDSPLRSRATARYVGSQLDALLSAIEALRLKQACGPLMADETKTIPALASNAKRLIDLLGTGVKGDPDEDGDL